MITDTELGNRIKPLLGWLVPHEDHKGSHVFPRPTSTKGGFFVPETNESTALQAETKGSCPTRVEYEMGKKRPATAGIPVRAYLSGLVSAY